VKNLLIPIDPNITKPLYLQIVDHVTRLAKNGQLKPGQQLPPSRTLADQISVHRSTVINAYEELKARGVIETRQGSGSYIAPGLAEGPLEIQPAPIASGSRPDELVSELWRLQWAEGIISLGLALPADELMPVEDFERTRQRVLRRDGPKTANYEQPQGFFTLRQAIAADLVRHGILVEADDIVVTAGALEGNSLVARALAAPGDHVLTEVPQYFGNLSNLIYLGLNPVGFELFETGPDWEALARQLQAAPVRSRFVFVTPDHQNPLGIRWDMTQRHRFLILVSAHDLPIVEDATYRDLTYDGPPHLPLRALDPEVIYVGTFSHALMPGLRIGFVVCSGRLREHIIRLKSVTSGAGETLNQRALAEYLKSGDYDRHLERIVPFYRARWMPCWKP